jgi:ribosome-associated protein
MPSQPLVIHEELILPAADLSWTAVRSSGPGGQNVNKVASKVELRFDLARTEALSEAVKARLRARAAGRLDAEGRLLVTSQLTRDRERNLEDARRKLRELVLAALAPPRPRRPTRPTASSKRRRLDEKRRRGARKRERADRNGPD